MAKRNLTQERDKTIQQVAERMVGLWFDKYESNPEHYEQIVLKQVAESIGYEIRKVAKERIQSYHAGTIEKLMEKALDEWLVEEKIAIPDPSEDLKSEVRKVFAYISGAVSSPALKNAATKKKIAVYRLRAKGITYPDIAKGLKITPRQAKQMYRSARSDLDFSLKTVAAYQDDNEE